MIRVSIVEDDGVFAGVLAWALSKHRGIDVAGKHLSAEEALSAIPLACPDVVLMDIHMPGMNGIECLRRLKQVEPKLKARVVFLTGDSCDAVVFEALEAGPAGYLTKDEPLDDLSRHIHTVHKGGAAMSPHIMGRVMETFEKQLTTNGANNGHALSEREGEVLVLLAGGKMYKEIGDKLSISINTVRKHLQAVYGKLHVSSRHEATQYYNRQQRRET